MRLTKTQEGLLNAELVAGGPISNVCGATFFMRPFSAGQLNAAVNTVLRINDALRLRIDPRTRTQWLEEYERQEFDSLQFEDQEAFETYAQSYAEAPLDPAGRLYDVKIVLIGDKAGLIYKFHHIVCDAWSLSLLRWQLYEILEKKADPVAFSFAEYCDKELEYLNSKRFEKDRVFFTSQYEKNRDRVFHPDCYAQNYAAGSIGREIPSDLVSDMNAYTKKAGISMFVFLLGAFAVCYSKQHDDAGCFYLGTTVLNRTMEKDLHTIGPFINDIPLLIELDCDGTGEKAVLRTEEIVMDAFRHQRFNYPMLQEEMLRQGSDIRLFDVIFNYQAEIEVLDGYQAQWYQNGVQVEPLQIHVDHRNDGSKLMVTYNYLAEKYSSRDIDRIHKHYMNVLKQIVADDQRPLASVSLMDQEETEQILSFSQGEKAPLPEKSIYSLFEEQHAGQIMEGGKYYSLDELRRDAEKIDAAVHGQKRVIGVICDRSYIELAAVYGIVRGGNAYLPISPDYPSDRIRLMLQAAACDTVLVQKKYQSLVPGSIAVEDILSAPDPAGVPPVSAGPDDTLYVIFTSGSTGTPKGAMISNCSAANRVLWMCKRYFDRDTVIMLKTPYTFDVSVWEIFGFALGGFTLYILPPDDHYRQDRVLDHIRKGKVTDLHFVPSVFTHFLEALKKDGGTVPSLKNIFLSGEAMTAGMADASPVPVHNLYGPTECAVDVTYYDCHEREEDPLPIGKPIDNCRIYVLDRKLCLLPAGTAGQICIGGIPVGQGYMNDPVRTETAFKDDPYGEGRLYLTGDLGYWREDGCLVYIGRNDQQIKINGQRVEPGEIETALSAFVPAAAVTAEKGHIIAFYTGPEKTDLRREMSGVLPLHMIPHMFVHVDGMPLTESGKIDRRALLSLPRKKAPAAAEPVTRKEHIVTDTVREVLSLSCVSMEDNFYDIGGDSLSAVHILSRLQEQGYELPVPVFLRCETLSEAAEKMEELSCSGTAGSAPEREKTSVIMPLYVPQDGASAAIVLFSFAGGNETAYISLVAEFRKRHADTALYYCPWTEEYDRAEADLRSLAGRYPLSFYSHCAGAVTAMKLLDRINKGSRGVSRYVIGANIPPADTHNIWDDMTDEAVLAVLQHAGMPDMPETQRRDMLLRFRDNTREYFGYFCENKKKTPVDITLVLSTEDLFTQDFPSARDLWGRYVDRVGEILLFDWQTHYFQSAQAARLADILLSGRTGR